MKKIIRNCIFGIIFLVGLSLLLYPYIANQWNTYRQSRLMTTYEEEVAKIDRETPIDYSAQWEQARAYNDELMPYVLPDSFAVAAASEEPDEEYMACLNLTGNGMMGYVNIPKINVKIPIYHTVKEDVLQTAAGHLEGSSLPVGGESTHAVISAHRGLPSAALFTDLDRLKEGDHFLVAVLDEILCYEVDRVSVVEPQDTDDLKIENGKDLVTLLTCTPYGVNSHRLLVRGHRVDYVEETVMKEEVPLGEISIHTNYLLWIAVGLSVTGLFILVLYITDRKRREK